MLDIPITTDTCNNENNLENKCNRNLVISLSTTTDTCYFQSNYLLTQYHMCRCRKITVQHLENI